MIFILERDEVHAFHLPPDLLSWLALLSHIEVEIFLQVQRIAEVVHRLAELTFFVVVVVFEGLAKVLLGDMQYKQTL